VTSKVRYQTVNMLLSTFPWICSNDFTSGRWQSVAHSGQAATSSQRKWHWL